MLAVQLCATVSYPVDILTNAAQMYVKHDKMDSKDFQKCAQCCGCNTDSMSSLYQLQNAVTIPEVAEFKHKEGEKKGSRLLVVALDSFPTYETDVRTHVLKKPYKSVSTSSILLMRESSHVNHLSELVFLSLLIIILLSGLSKTSSWRLF